jgi:hypothetical protein
LHGLCFKLYRDALDAPRFVNDALEEPSYAFIIERARVDAGDVIEHLFLARRRVNRLADLALDTANLNRARRSFVQQAHQLFVYAINLVTPAIYTQFLFAHLKSQFNHARTAAATLFTSAHAG